MLGGASSYTGATVVNDGTLLVTNTSGSATGTGAVQVNSGTLGGTGIIAGTVTLGPGTGRGAFLAPGRGRTNIGTLTLQSTLIFNAAATYNCGVSADTATADQVVANGVTINSATTFSLVPAGNNALPIGSVFTVIGNSSASPISGPFTNLADGATVSAGGNNFQANYEGGDGNDLTLTVVP